MKDVTQDVIDFVNEAATRKLGLRSAKADGRYANRVRIVATEEMPTSFAGATGVIARIHDDGNVFVRLHERGREVTVPFGISQIEVIS